MALSFNSSSSKLVSSSSPISAYPFSMFCWIKPANVTAALMIGGVGDFGNNDELAIYSDGATAGDPFKAISKVGATSTQAATSNSVVTTDWQPCLGVFISATERYAYLVTGNGAVNTVSNAPNLANFDRFVIGVRPNSDTLWFSGSLAHCAIWDRALTRGDFELLAKGARPDTVSSSDLIDYWSLESTAATQTGVNGTVLTASNTSTAGDAPTIVDPLMATLYPVAAGCWTFFNNPRAIEYDNALYYSAITSGGSPFVGKIDYTTLTNSNFTLNSLMEQDDHDNPALLQRSSDGKLVAFYSKHVTDQYLRYRVQTTAGDISAWATEVTVGNTSAYGNSYANPFEIAGDSNACYVLSRLTQAAGNHRWIYRRTADWTTWDADVTFWETGSFQQYLVFAKNGTNRVDVFASDMHPDNDTGGASLYHFYCEWDTGSSTLKWYNSAGTAQTLPLDTTKATLVYDGSGGNDGWTHDIAIDADGYPRVLFQKRVSTAGTGDWRLMFSRWNGSAWTTPVEIATLGGYLYSGELAYTGCSCFDGNDVNKVYAGIQVSSIYEMQEWGTADNGASWSKTADITTGTASGINARPISPKNYSRAALMFLSGTYTSYTNYSTSVNLLLEPASTTLTPSLFSNTNTFYSATVSQGLINLLPSLFSNTNTFFQPVVSVGAVNLLPSLLNNNNTFYAATVSTGSVSLLPSLFSNTNAFYSPIVSNGELTLFPSLFENSNTFYSHTVAVGSVSLTPSLFENSNTFYNHVVSNGAVILLPSLFSNTNAFYSATVSTGVVALSPVIFENQNVFYSPTIYNLDSFLLPSLFSNSNTFYAATVSPGSVILTPSLFENSNVFYSHTVSHSATVLTPSLFSNTNTFYASSISVGGITLLPSLFNNSNIFYNASVSIAGSDQQVIPGSYHAIMIEYGTVVIVDRETHVLI